MCPVMDMHHQPAAEEIGLRICKNCFRIKGHSEYKGSGKVCRKCKDQVK